MKKLLALITLGLLVQFSGFSQCQPEFSSTTDFIAGVRMQKNGGPGFEWNHTKATGVGYSDQYNNATYNTDLNKTDALDVRLQVDGNGTYFARVYIDFDNNGTYELDKNLGSQATVAGIATWNFNLTGADFAAAASFDEARMRIVMHYNAAVTGPCMSSTWGEGIDYRLTFDCDGTPIAKNLNTIDGNNIGAPRGATMNELLSFRITSTGCDGANTLSNVQVDFSNSDDVSGDISAAHLHYSSSNDFSTSTLLKTVTNPGNSVTFSGLTKQFGPRTHYLWVSADVKAGATLDNFVSAELVEVSFSGGAGSIESNAVLHGKRRQIINSYCTPTYTQPVATSRSIKRVRFKGIDYTNGNITTGHIDRSLVDFDELLPGETQALRINWDQGNILSVGTPVNFTVYAWIDWDRDGTFQTSERIFIGQNENNPAGTDSFDVTQYVTVPKNAKGGFTKLRVRLMYTPITDPCAETRYGQNLDFGVRVCGQGQPVMTGEICENSGVLSLSGPNTKYAPYEWESSLSISGPWVQSGVIDGDYSIPALDSTKYFRARMNVEGCTNSDGFSSIFTAARPHTTSLTANPVSLCPGDSSLLETRYTYPSISLQSAPGTAIPDPINANVEPAASVSASLDFTGSNIAPLQMDGKTLEKVCFTISHPEVGDLRGLLRHVVSGKEMLLFDRNLSGSDITNACITNYSSGLIQTGSAPYTGEFEAPQQFVAFEGENPNSAWEFVLQDFVGGNAGTIENFDVYFGGATIEWFPNQNLRTNLGDSTKAQPTTPTFYTPAIQFNNCSFVSDSIEIQPFGSATAEVNITDSSLTFPFCDGESITFTATPSAFPAGSNYVWEHNGVVVGFDQDTYTASNFLDGDTLAIILNLVTPCITVSDTDTVFMQITLPFTPEVELSTSSSGLICQGEPTEFLLDIIEGGSNPTVEWYVQSGATRTNVQTGGTSYTDNGNLLNGDSVFVFLNAEEVCATPQLVSDTIEVILTPVENITWTLDATYPTEVCEGTMIRFEGDSGLGTSFSESEIIWTLNGDTIPVDSIIWEVDTLAAGNYTVIAEYKGGGCSSPASISESHTFEVFASEEKFVLAKTVDPWNCALDEVTLVAHTYSGLGVNGYFNWYRGNVLLQGPGFNGDTLVLDQGVNGETITCEIISTRSCSFDLGNGLDKFDLVIVDNEDGLIEISTDAPLVCETDDVTFLGDFVFGGGDNPSYEWYVDGNLTDVTSVPEWHVNGLATGSLVHAELVSTEQCVYPRKPKSNTAFVKYVPTLPVSAELNLPSNTGCETETVAANLSPYSNLGTDPKVTWYKNNILQPGQTGISYVFEAPASGVYEIYARVESSVQCPSDPVIETSKKEVEVFDQPEAEFIFERDGDTYFFVADDQSAADYVWDFNGEASATGAVTSYKFVNSGNKTVCLTVTSADGCVSRFCTQFLVLVGIEEFEKIDFDLFPNPTDNNLNLSGNFESFEIINALGQVVHRQAVQEGMKNHLISVSELTSGMYTIRVKDGAKYGVRTFVRK